MFFEIIDFPHTPGIYAIWVLDANGVEYRMYIGSTENLRKRVLEHIRTLRKNQHINKYMQNSWNKYGEVRFRWEILEHIDDKNNLVDREQFWIDNILTKFGKNFLFNICLTAYNTLGRNHSIASRQKMRGPRPSTSLALKNRPKSFKHKAALASNHRLGSSSRRGVHKNGRNWSAVAPGNIYIGTFSTIEEAATAYNHVVSVVDVGDFYEPSVRKEIKEALEQIKNPDEIKERMRIGHLPGQSGVKGVSWNSSQKKWKAQSPGRQRIHLGYFDTIEEASAAIQKQRFML